MADQTPTDHPTARLVLDYIRALLWPGLIVWAFIALQDEMLDILRTREVEVAGAFKIGKSIEDLNRKAQAEIDDLRRMVAGLQANPQDPARVREVTEAVSANLEALERNFGRDLAQIRMETAGEAPQRQAMPERRASPQPSDSRATAQAMEQEGFEALLRRDLDAAIAAFADATRHWPDYHNVAEIERLLRTSRQRLVEGGDAAWQEVYRTILTRYSWGMPASAREAMKQALGGWY